MCAEALRCVVGNGRDVAVQTDLREAWLSPSGTVVVGKPDRPNHRRPKNRDRAWRFSEEVFTLGSVRLRGKRCPSATPDAFGPRNRGQEPSDFSSAGTQAEANKCLKPSKRIILPHPQNLRGSMTEAAFSYRFGSEPRVPGRLNLKLFGRGSLFCEPPIHTIYRRGSSADAIHDSQTSRSSRTIRLGSG